MLRILLEVYSYLTGNRDDRRLLRGVSCGVGFVLSFELFDWLQYLAVSLATREPTEKVGDAAETCGGAMLEILAPNPKYAAADVNLQHSRRPLFGFLAATIDLRQTSPAGSSERAEVALSGARPESKLDRI